MMEKVVTDGTGSEAAVPGYTVAGKTGTAQVALPNGRGYAKGTYIGSFIGYLPADDPQILICVKLDQPRNAIYGGTVAAPVFSKLAQFSGRSPEDPADHGVRSLARRADLVVPGRSRRPVHSLRRGPPTHRRRMTESSRVRARIAGRNGMERA